MTTQRMTEQALRQADGTAQAERIAAFFGWNLLGYGFANEGVHFGDPRNPRLDNTYDPPQPHDVAFRPGDSGEGPGRALLRYILGQEPALAPEWVTVPAPVDPVVYFYFDVTLNRHIRCTKDHPWAGRAVEPDGNATYRLR